MRADRRRRLWRFAPVAVVLVTALAAAGARAADPPIPGSQGVDTSLPATDSQVTVTGRGQFANLAITVNQTENLVTQAVSITWTGGAPTRQGPGRFASDYLQIMQCWGDDDGTVAENPGPPPEQCVQGAVGARYEGPTPGLFSPGYTLSRIISRRGWPNYDPADGTLDPVSNSLWLPFRAVNGTVVGVPVNSAYAGAGDYWLNPFFNLITTNEIPGAVTATNGRGAELFQVETGVESSGLGCGKKTQLVAGGEPKIPRCWIVIVPRGTPTAENAGTPFENPDQVGVISSPVSPAAWANRIAIPIEFKPVDSPCTLADVERRVAGNELVLTAVVSWQPALCAGGALPPYSYATVGDASARQQIAASQPGSPGMVVVSRPLSANAADPASPALYAPVSVSGVVIGFNVERTPTPDAPAAANGLAGVRVAEINLTPRLVAKLLTQSYGDQVRVGNATPNYAWLAGNPRQMVVDPDFLQFNPEFAILQTNNRTFGGLQLPSNNSDAAAQLWEWVLADPEARAWLDGEPDEWGMNVNSVYATLASANSSGIAFGDPIPNSFPKADSFCYQGPLQGELAGVSILPPLLCGTDWMPYNRGLVDGARIARAGDDSARIVNNPFAIAPSDVWKREAPQQVGSKVMLSLTDTPSAVRFGLQTARLSRAGDNGADRRFIAADVGGLTAGVASMTARSEPTVLEPTHAATAPGAYPLTAISYAVIKPLSLDSQARSEYAAFLDYAAGPGQIVGPNIGQLPTGYAPLSDDMQARTRAIAALVRTMTAATAEQPTTTLPNTVDGTSQPTNPPTIQPGGGASTPRPSTGSSSPRPSGGAVPSGETDTSTSLEPVSPTETSLSAEAPTATSVAPGESSVSSAPSAPAPALALTGARFAVAGAGVIALGSALGALEITKRTRRGAPEASLLDLLEQIDGP